MPEVLEIETTTTLRGPLAERLLVLAKARSREPVEQVADIVERALKEEGRFEDNLNTVRRLTRELGSLRQRYQEAVAARPTAVEYLPKMQDALSAEARRRNLSLDKLVYEIIRAVVDDNLFTAVLDSD